MIPAARRAHFHRMDGKFQPLAREFSYLRLASRAPGAATQGLPVYPASKPHLALADGAGLVHIDAVVLRSGTEEEIGVAQLLTAHPSRAEVTQMLRALPFIGDLVAIRHR